MTDVNRNKSVALIVLILVSAGLYLNTLSSEFVSDDIQQVVKNEWIRSFGNIKNVFISSVWAFSEEGYVGDYYRPFMHLFYMVSFKLSGLESWGYHAINITLHTLNTVMVFVLTYSIINQTPREPDRGERDPSLALFTAFFAALLFTVNPINTEAVAWVASVPELSATLFLFLSLYFYIKERRFISALFFLCSLFSKETGMVLIFFLIALDLVIKRESVFPVKRWFLKLWPYGVALLVYAAMRFNAIGGVVSIEPERKILSGYEGLLNIMPLTFQFLKNLAVPVNLTFFHQARVDYIFSFFELRSILYTAVLLAAIYLFARYNRRERLLSFSIVWIILPLLPVFYLGFVKGEAVYADRYLYLSSAGFSIVVVLLLLRIAKRLTQDETLRSAFISASIVILLISSLYATGTVRRNVIWQSGLTLWQDSALKAPEVILVRLSYANQLLKAGRFDESFDEYSFVVKEGKLKNNLAGAYNGLGIIYANKGMLDAAIDEFRLSLMVDSDYETARKNLERAERLKKDNQK